MSAVSDKNAPVYTETATNMTIVINVDGCDPDFHVSEVGHSSPPAGYRVDNMLSSTYVIHFLTKGCGSFNSVPIKEGKGFLIAPDSPFSFKFDELDPWEHYWLRLDGSRVELVLRSLGFSLSSHVFDCSGWSRMVPTFEAMINRRLDEEKPSLAMLGLFYGSVAYVNPRDAFKPDTSADGYIRVAREFIEQNYAAPIGVEDIARAANISSKYLCRIFRKKVGIPPSACLVSVRLDRARVLLERTSLPVVEIARTVGYNQASYFTASFVRAYGCTPLEYRRR